VFFSFEHRIDEAAVVILSLCNNLLSNGYIVDTADPIFADRKINDASIVENIRMNNEARTVD
jgi:hypothetical protein